MPKDGARGSLKESNLHKVIIDTDPGIDDAFALAFAVASGLEIVGITTTHGNGGVDETSTNAKVMMRMLGRSDVQVYKGSPDPIRTFEVTHASHSGVTVHGNDGLGEVRPPLDANDSEFGRETASEFIYKACSESPGDVTIVTLGPMTNLAQCLEDHPDLTELAKGVVAMGGAFGEKRGNRTPSGEANFVSDPAAASAVLNAGFDPDRVTLAGLDVTHSCDLLALRQELLLKAGDVGRLLYDISHHYCAAYFKLGHSSVPVHDPVTIAYILDPSLFDEAKVRVDVEVESEITRGHSAVDWTGQSGKPRNCRILTSVKAKEFSSLFVRALCDFESKSSPALPVKALVPPNVRVGVGVVLVMEGKEGHVLVSRRKGSHGSGMLQLPGGHLEHGESWDECAIRETEEETGIKLGSVSFAGVTNDVMANDGKHYVTIFMAGVCPTGTEARLMEPHKCDGWSWERWDELPGPLFEPLQKFSSAYTLPTPDALLSGAPFPPNMGFVRPTPK